MTPNDARRYTIIEPLGKGGFGTVYRAELLSAGGFRKQVALKLLHPEMEAAGDVARRLRDEARILGLVSHRAIVQVDGLVQVDGRWAVVMEYVEGVGLDQLLKRERIPLGVAFEIVEETADALNAAHTATIQGRPLNLRHRDLKPSNLQLTRTGSLKLLDFGVARAEFEERETSTQSALIGTWKYMAPECWEFRDGLPADIYALGVILYNMITRRGLERSTANELKHTMMLDSAMASLEGVVSEPVQALVRSMLAYNPASRPTAREVQRICKDLRPHLGAPWLRDWAEQAVAAAHAARQPIAGDTLSGNVLTEQSTFTRVDPTPAPVPAPRRIWPVLVLSSLLLVGLGGAVWALLLARPSSPADENELKPTPPTEPEIPFIDDLPISVPAPSVDAPLELEVPTQPPESSSSQPPSPKVKANDPGKAASKVGSTPSGAETRPSETTGAENTPKGRVLIQGGAREVWLLQGSHRFPAGEIPAGSYKIEADFPEAGRIVSGTVVVAPGATVTIKCDAAFKLCRAN